jgi:ankyrin repeat protein
MFITPIKVIYWQGKLHSTDNSERVVGLTKLLGMGKNGFDPLVQEFGSHDAAMFMKTVWEDVNLENSDGMKPVHVAVQNEYSKVLEFLILKGVDVNDPFKSWSIQSRLYGNSITTLIDSKFYDANSKRYKRYPLHFAVEKNNMAIVRLLLENGAKSDVNDNHGSTPLHYAALYGCAEIASLIIKRGADVNAKDTYEHTPLHCAAMSGDVATAEVLIEGGANLSAKQHYSMTPLHYSAYFDHPSLIKLLITKGEDVNTLGPGNSTPLHEAARNNSCKAIKTIIGLNGNINARERHGDTPLHISALFGQYNATKLLIDSGANINAETIYHMTPLHGAVEKDRTNIIRLLIKNGINLHARIGKGRWGSVFTADRNRNGPPGMSRIYPPESTSSMKSDHNISMEGWTSLHSAAWLGMINSARILIEFDSDIEAEDHINLRPLHIAAANGWKNLVSLLLDNNASINPKDRFGMTPLDWAIKFEQNATVEELRERGGKPALDLKK